MANVTSLCFHARVWRRGAVYGFFMLFVVPRSRSLSCFASPTLSSRPGSPPVLPPLPASASSPSPPCSWPRPRPLLPPLHHRAPGLGLGLCFLPFATRCCESIPAPVAKKTAKEVWRERDIQSATAGGDANQPSMYEMTLEDFLSRAGIAVDAGRHWMHQYLPQQQYALSRPLPLPALALDAAYHGSCPRVFFSHSQVAGRKRATATVARDDFVERTVERRQKRMIKNRESAARSRARKQAYNNELENKVARLEEENKRLIEFKNPDGNKVVKEVIFGPWDKKYSYCKDLERLEAEKLLQTSRITKSIRQHISIFLPP